MTYALVIALLPDVRSQKDDVSSNEEEPEPEVFILMALISYIPLILLIFLSVAISIKLRKVMIRKKSLTSNMSSSDKSTAKATLVVLVVCLTFILLTLPGTLLISVYGYLEQGGMGKPETELVETIATICLLLNNSLNLVLYVAFSDKFRQVLLGNRCFVFLGICQRHQNPGTCQNRSLQPSTSATALKMDNISQIKSN